MVCGTDGRDYGNLDSPQVRTTNRIWKTSELTIENWAMRGVAGYGNDTDSKQAHCALLVNLLN